MSGRIAKSQIPLKRHESLPPDAKFALIEAKNTLRGGIALALFRNQQGRQPGEGPPLPRPAQGCQYVEKQVGQAHPGDLRSAGSHRLVLEVNVASGQILEVYYTEEHYAKDTFFRIV
jgi:hypothetical protein